MMSKSFLHYKNPEEAKEKWTRRCKRVNLNNIVLKYSYMNDPNEDCLKEFDAIPVKRKLCSYKIRNKKPNISALDIILDMKTAKTFVMIQINLRNM